MASRLLQACRDLMHHFQIGSLFYFILAKRKQAMKVTKRKTKYNIRKYFSAFSVENFRCSLCIGGQQKKNGKMARKRNKGAHQLKVMVVGSLI